MKGHEGAFRAIKGHSGVIKGQLKCFFWWLIHKVSVVIIFLNSNFPILLPCFCALSPNQHLSSWLLAAAAVWVSEVRAGVVPSVRSGSVVSGERESWGKQRAEQWESGSAPSGGYRFYLSLSALPLWARHNSYLPLAALRLLKLSLKITHCQELQCWQKQ